MIKLTVNPDLHPREYSFDQPVVIIGAESTGMATLSLPEERLQSVHIKIIEQNGSFVIINAANDPFVTLNDLPFGKKILANHDLLQIGKTKIRLQFSFQPAQKNDISEESSVLDLETLFREVEKLDLPAPQPPAIQESIPPIQELPDHEPLVDLDAVESAADSSSEISSNTVDDEGDNFPNDKPKEEALTQRGFHPDWRAILSILLAVFIMVTITASTIYIKATSRSYKEKIIAAEGVADVAMALAYAQVNHIRPQKQNWFDPNFIKNNLSAVLSSGYPSFANIDNQGQFQNCPYILRIYTNTDLSQFLVIAQPEPSLLQWLIPKATIAVDSTDMRLRYIDDVKPLNRLLVNPNTLDGSNALEITYLLKQGQIIPLASLGDKKGFATPKALALIRPGADNLVYNAPRYYQFGEALLKKGINLLQFVGGGDEIIRLQQQLTELGKFPDLILYSSQGMQKALQAQKALSTLLPHNQFLTAYLNFNPNGSVISSHLLLDGNHSEHVTLQPSIAAQPQDLGNLDTTAMLLPSDHRNKSTVEKQNTEIDRRHPLLLQLTALAHDRYQALKAISDDIVILLESRNRGLETHFSKRFADLSKQYEQLNEKYQNKVSEGLDELYIEYSSMPLTQFRSYVKAAGLELLAQESLAKRALEKGKNLLTPEQVAAQMEKIHLSKDFSELDAAVTEAAQMINLVYLPDPTRVIIYQNELHNHVVQQINRFMLSPNTKLPLSAFTPASHAALSHILKSAWVTDPDEADFYLNEFQLLANDAKK